MKHTIEDQKDLLASFDGWWKQRVEQTIELEGWTGRDLRNQDTLLKTVLNMEQDITFLLRYVRELTVRLAQQCDERSKLPPRHSDNASKEANNTGGEADV